eukprot:jgi/Psemu1/18800/gm1.18800_g
MSVLNSTAIDSAGAGAYQIQDIPKLIAFYHVAAGYPTKDTWVQAIDRCSFATWPGLTARRIVQQGIQSTCKKKTRNKKDTDDKDKQPKTLGQKKIHDVCVDVMSTSDIQLGAHVDPHTGAETKEQIAWDLPGRYPVTSCRGHQYVFLMYDCDSTTLKWSPSSHAKRVIQTFKNHFKAVLNGVDEAYPVDDWDLLIPQALITLNLEEINGHIYAIELLLGMEEFLKYAGTFDEVFKEDNKGVLNLDKMVVHFINSKRQSSPAPFRALQTHKRYDNYCGMKLLFRAHPSFKSDSGQLSNVWYDWANFQLDLLDGRSLQVYPCQILCLLHLEGPFPPGSSASGFELVHDGYYAVACCFLSVDPISSKRDKAKRDCHTLVKQGELRNKLYLFDCNAIESEVAVVRNLGRKDHYFVLRNRERWLFHFCHTMAGLEKQKMESIVKAGEITTDL